LMNDKLSYTIRKKGNITILDLFGKIIGSWAFTLKEELMRLKESDASSVILNFQGVTSIDSLGIMAITSALESGLFIKITHLNTSCREILEQNRAANLFLIYGTEEEAIGNTIVPNHLEKDMRRYKRINTNIPIEIQIDDCNHRGVLLNISEVGALVGYLDPLSIEPYTINHINIRMKIPVIGTMELEGKPIRFGRTSEMHIIGIELFSTEKSRKLVKQVYNENNPPPE